MITRKEISSEGPAIPRPRYRAIPGEMVVVFRMVILSLATTLLAAPQPPAAFQLTHRLRAGDDLVYDFSSTLRQESSVSGEKLLYNMTLSGAIRQTVVDVTPEAGSALVGLMGTGTWQMVSGPGGISGTTRDQTWIATYRLEPNGKIVPRATRKEDRAQNLIHRTMNQMSENAQIFPAFPTNRLSVGDRWEGPVLLPLPGIRQPGRGAATVTGHRIVNDAPCFVIKCDIASEKGQSFATYQSSINRPDIEIKGSSEGVFDIERGLWLSTQIELTARITGPSFDGTMAVKGHTSLAGAGLLSDATVGDRAAKIRAFEQAIATLYENDVEAAEKALREQKDSVGDAQWKAGVATTLGLIEVARKELAGDGHHRQGDDRPETALLARADKAAQEEKWKEAVELYEKVASDFPSTETAVQALTSAADIYHRRLDKKNSASSLRRRIVEMREDMAKRQKGSAETAIALYKQAGAYETAGDLKKAAETFEAFLAAPTNGIPTQTRLLAQYRLAGVFDKLGDRTRASAAYRAVAAVETDDDYSRKLKVKAGEKLAGYNAER